VISSTPRKGALSTVMFEACEAARRRALLVDWAPPCVYLYCVAGIPAGDIDRGGRAVPLFMDVHNTLPEGATAKDVAGAHAADVKTQDKYGVKYLNYWVDDKAGKVFCLVEAPNAEAAHTVHQEAHGLVADEIYPVEQG
jgi:hypothetical protein